MMVDVLRDELMRDEGYRLKPYVDTVGKITIGIGRNLSDKGITKDMAFAMLDEDLDEVIGDLATFPWFKDLDGVRQRVLCNMRFNLGPSRFRSFTNTLAAIERGDYEKAADNMLQSRWAKQVGQRAIRLSRMMRTGAA